MSWSILILLTVVTMQTCLGQKSCTIWTSVGKFIQLGHSFQVFCHFKYDCKITINPKQRPSKFNSTTIYFNVSNITKDNSFTCNCVGSTYEPCGLDISTGYPPQKPHYISCIYKIKTIQSGDVVCTWDKGPETYLPSSSVLWVTTSAGENSSGPASYSAKETKGTETLTASFILPTSVQRISVWVRTENKLASVNSSSFNYTLSDVAMPSSPVLGRPTCSSWTCVIKVDQSVRTKHLEIQYKPHQETWKTHQPNPDMQRKSSQNWSIGSLEPFRLYHFRARSKFSTGLWSNWSQNTSGWTEEEAPAEKLDVWFVEPESDGKPMHVYWKKANMSISRGRIIEYVVSVDTKPRPGKLSADARSSTLAHCTECEVTVSARNSKGLSPPAKIMTRRVTGNPPQDVRVTQSNDSVAICWRRPDTAPFPTGYVVEWYPQGRRQEEVNWVRLGSEDNLAVISDMRRSECYEGAVYDLHQDRIGRGTRLNAVAIAESTPLTGPNFSEMVDGKRLKVAWELPRSQRGGCITKYTFYLESDGRITTMTSDGPWRRTTTISNLSTGEYFLWMTASTAEGEGPISRKAKVFIVVQETPLSALLVCGVAAAIMLLLLCLFQSSAVKQRFWEFFQCIMLDVVPDPANSKWAKECSQEKGELNLQLQLGRSTETEEEQEPILVDVEELPRPSADAPALKLIPSQLHRQTSLRRDGEPASPLCPPTTYIKSFSHDSDSSEQTHTSMDTTTTVDYISSHGPGDLDEEDEDGEDEFADMDFFPGQNSFMDFGGKLTLDAVKIDCSNFFQNLDV